MSYHKNIVHKITQQVGLDDGQSFLNQSLYFVFIGSNDFLGNYIRNSSHDSKLTPQQFIDLLISSYATQLKVRNLSNVFQFFCFIIFYLTILSPAIHTWCYGVTYMCKQCKTLAWSLEVDRQIDT